MFIEDTIGGYLEKAQSDAPTPGGGSVSALAGALGSCMASMAANFTVGKKKFAEVEAEVIEILAEIQPQREKLVECMERDAVAFAAIGEAYGMPKNTDDEKAARAAAIQNALTEAMEVPLAGMRAALACLQPLPRLAEIGNPNLVSDTGVAAILLAASARALCLNVKINLKNIKNEELVKRVTTEVDKILQTCQEEEKQCLEAVNAMI